MRRAAVWAVARTPCIGDRGLRAELARRSVGARSDGQLQSLCSRFARHQLSEMSATELREWSEVLAVSDETLSAMMNMPAVSDRPPYLQNNSVLTRFLSFARYHTDRGEFG
eukprot:m.164161 g.164161  ORF g.164161 m.164161 type:complete len:111 (-) comp12389_c0_seq1:85-417(-)